VVVAGGGDVTVDGRARRVDEVRGAPFSPASWASLIAFASRA